MKGPFAPVKESKARGGPWVLPGVLIALAIAMSVFVLCGVAMIVALAVFT